MPVTLLDEDIDCCNGYGYYHYNPLGLAQCNYYARTFIDEYEYFVRKDLV